jgi:hypothetical protein
MGYLLISQRNREGTAELSFSLITLSTLQIGCVYAIAHFFYISRNKMLRILLSSKLPHMDPKKLPRVEKTTRHQHGANLRECAAKSFG